MEKDKLSKAQHKLPKHLQDAIAKGKKKSHKKHMDAKDVKAKDIDGNGEIDGWEVGKANAIKKGLEKEKKDESYRSFPSFVEWVKLKEGN